MVARKGDSGLLFTLFRKGGSLEFPQYLTSFPSIKKWEAMIFCPEGLSSQDLKQADWKRIQAWFIDLQTGSIFPSPPTEDRRMLNLVLSYLNPESSVPGDSHIPSGKQAYSPVKPYLTYTLIAINLIVFALMTLAGGSTNPAVLVLFGAKVNSLILQGEFWRLFTSMFLHIGILHLAFNLYALWILGPIMEEFFGRIRYILIYIISGLMGSFASFLFTDAISAGASGAIFGLLGALVVYSRRRPALWKSGFGKSLAVIIIINLVLGFMEAGIDIYAHFGGLIGGMVLSAIIPSKYEG